MFFIKINSTRNRYKWRQIAKIYGEAPNDVEVQFVKQEYSTKGVITFTDMESAGAGKSDFF